MVRTLPLLRTLNKIRKKLRKKSTDFFRLLWRQITQILKWKSTVDIVHIIIIIRRYETGHQNIGFKTKIHPIRANSSRDVEQCHDDITVSCHDDGFVIFEILDPENIRFQTKPIKFGQIVPKMLNYVMMTSTSRCPVMTSRYTSRWRLHFFSKSLTPKT